MDSVHDIIHKNVTDYNVSKGCPGFERGAHPAHVRQSGSEFE